LSVKNGRKEFGEVTDDGDNIVVDEEKN